jgi:hypothetical protein
MRLQPEEQRLRVLHGLDLWKAPAVWLAWLAEATAALKRAPTLPSGQVWAGSWQWEEWFRLKLHRRRTE